MCITEYLSTLKSIFQSLAHSSILLRSFLMPKSSDCWLTVNPGLHGSLSRWVSPGVLCWVLFSSSYILLTFPLSFQSIRLLVISLLTTFRHMFMVFLLVNFFSPAKLNYFQIILTLGCPQIDSL